MEDNVISKRLAGWRAALMTAAALALLGCGSGGGGGSAPTPSPTSNPPSITSQPQAVTVTEGQAASFSVTAAGTAPLTYQWQRGGAIIAGAIGATYTLNAATLGDSGAQFSVIVSNSAGNVTSSATTLTVNPVIVPPSITTQPQSVTVTAGQTATFTVVAAGTAPLAYQWRRNGVDIAGATSASYTTPATAVTDSGAVFMVRVSNASPALAVSNGATLTVNAQPPTPTAPEITTQPQNASVTAGQTATFSVAATGTAPLSYQWRRNGTDIAGATSASYTTPATTLADNGAQFSVVVSNAVGSVTSAATTLSVSSAPPPAPSDRLVAVSAFTLAIRNDGSVIGWGDNNSSQLGSGPLIGGTLARQITVPAASIAAGDLGGVALRAEGSVVGWGTNAAGWLGGESDTSSPVYSTPQPVSWPQSIRRVAVQSRANENSFLFALAADGTVWHFPGERAISGTLTRYSPSVVPSLSGVAELASGHGLMHAVRDDGTVWRFDISTTFGEPLRYNVVATQVAGLANIARVTCGSRHCLALTKDGSLWAWGDGRTGQLGNGADVISDQPVRVLNLADVTHIAVTSVFGASVARTADGRVWTWGRGELSGRPEVQSGFFSLPPPNVNVPTELPSLSGIEEVACSDRHCVARAAAGSVWAWGDNLYQQLGVAGLRRQVPVVATGINLN
jgi:alpha-tubulin suppressor-like RCC1 family protein